MSDATLRLNRLAEVIAARKRPLGSTPETECWGAVAAQLAGMPFAEGYRYYSLTPLEYQEDINFNASLDTSVRNAVMYERTLQRAASKEGSC